MRLIDADALKEKKVYSVERHETVVPVAEIDWMPTVDAKPVKRGKWLTCEDGDGWDDIHYQCSGCGNEWYLVDGTPEENGMNFCPNCGADLREVENDG